MSVVYYMMYTFMQIALYTYSCAVTIRKYEITVMDQYSPASITTYGSSIVIRRFFYNGTSIVANRVYNITVSAISDARESYPSDPIIVSKFSCTFVTRHEKTRPMYTKYTS